jgi:hypothetical protein
MDIKIDKTVLLAATIKALSDKVCEPTDYEAESLQLIKDILMSKQEEFIQSVTISEYEFSLVQSYLEAV